MQFPRGHRWWQTAAGSLLVTALLLFGGAHWVGRHLPQAERLAADRQWGAARKSLAFYLRFHPADEEARLLMARAYVSDDLLVGEDKVHAALAQLGWISPNSARSAEARLQEGRLYFLLLWQPGRAERCFLDVLQLEPARLEARILIWKLFDATNRWELGEEHFWQVYERTPSNERSIVLRDWYLSEFSPGTATAELDRRMGLLGETEQPSFESERRRLEAFVAADPGWLAGHAILARWFHRQGGRPQAIEQLDRAELLPGGADDPFVIAERILTSIEVGEFDEARRAFDRWPEPHEGYHFWKSQGLIADQVLRDDRQAVAAFEQAIATTPGKSDWLTQHRLAQCLTRLGDRERASTVRQHSNEVGSLMESPLHQQLRRVLSAPNAPQTGEEMANFYRRLGRLQESTAWQRLTIASEQVNVPPSVNSGLNSEHEAGTSSKTQSVENRARNPEPSSR